MVHVILPGDIDDPRRPSGGNVYDREVCRGLAALGWPVHEHPVRGRWPQAGTGARARLAAVLADLADDALVLVDGLVAAAAPTEMTTAGRRLRLVVLVHMAAGEDAGSGEDAGTGEDLMAGGPPSHAAEYSALTAATAVIVTSRWTRERLHRSHTLPGTPVHVVEPGVRSAESTDGTASGGRLVSVAAVTRAKGIDVLVEALGMIRDLRWGWVCVGPLDRQPAFVDRVRRRAEQLGLADRVTFTGPLAGTDIDAAYASADLLVHPSRADAYGMVVTEALARGIPVVAADVGGVSQALGRTADGLPPGVLVPPDDAGALAGALRRWLLDERCRARLCTAARERRATLAPWEQTAAGVAHVLAHVPPARAPRGGGTVAHR